MAVFGVPVAFEARGFELLRRAVPFHRDFRHLDAPDLRPPKSQHSFLPRPAIRGEHWLR